MDQYVLGVDAAWTEKQPSGVALMKLNKDRLPELVRAGRSYEEFLGNRVEWEKAVTGSVPRLKEILRECREKGEKVSIVALDIPLSPVPIIKRRPAENLITSAYGRYGAATHSPTPERPGVIATDIFNQLNGEGYNFSYKSCDPQSFIEVYPHAAIIELLNLEKRFPYKVHNKSKYWPEASKEERTTNILNNLNFLRKKLSEQVSNIEYFLPELDLRKKYSGKFLKGYEDMLDAIICALVGVFYLKGKAIPYGDEIGAIWVPKL